MNTISDWNGRLLATAMTERPALVLSFYSFGVMLRKQDGERVTEYPVDMTQVAAALADKTRFDTGLLSPNTLLIRQEGTTHTIVEYRPPCRTGLYLEGTEAALRIPLPALILIRTTTGDNTPRYAVYAVKQRPATLREPLFNAPLPNVFNAGGICWGSVRRVSDAALTDTSLAEDWTMLLGSPFGDHAVHDKSRAYPHDVRQGLLALERRGARTYPKRDLVPASKTLAQALGDPA